MPISPQLLKKNVFSALMFMLFISITSILLLSSLINEKNDEHKATIRALSSQIIINNNIQHEAEILFELLKTTKTYSKLSIYNKTAGIALNLNTDNSVLSFLASSTKNKVNIDNLNIEYQIDYSAESSLILTILITVAVLTFLLIFFITNSTTKAHKTLLESINKKIKLELSLFNETEKNDNKEHMDENYSFDIPELEQGIKKIKMLLSSQVEDSLSLEKKAYVDHLTNLDNRSRFVQFYENKIVQDSTVEFGVLLITRCSELQTINQIHGYNEGDKYISRVASIIKNTISTRPDAQLFRLNSSDFACILPNSQLSEGEALAKELTISFNEYQQASDLDSVAYTGLVLFTKTNPLGELLALADTSVSVAQTQHSNSWHSQKSTDLLTKDSVNYGNQNWRQEIDSVIENQRITLLLQPIKPSGHNNKIYGEILARFLNSSNDMLPTASFIAMAEKLDKIVAIDKLIIETAISEIKTKNMLEHSFGINLSPRSITDEHFMVWLERKLLRETTVAPHLIFEVSEYGLQQNIKTSKRLVDMLHRVGSRITVERFGVGLTSFKFFRDLTPDYIKMDSSYTRDIDDDKNNQYFLRLMVDLAHRLSISVLAESVESQNEKSTLEKLFIDGCQGYYIGKPEKL